MSDEEKAVQGVRFTFERSGLWVAPLIACAIFVGWIFMTFDQHHWIHNEALRHGRGAWFMIMLQDADPISRSVMMIGIDIALFAIVCLSLRRMRVSSMIVYDGHHVYGFNRLNGLSAIALSDVSSANLYPSYLSVRGSGARIYIPSEALCMTRAQATELKRVLERSITINKMYGSE